MGDNNKLAKFTLGLKRGQYEDILLKSTIRHSCYLNTKATLQKQLLNSDDLEENNLLDNYLLVDAANHINITLPYPYVSNHKIEINEDDLCNELLREKQRYQSHLEHSRGQYVKYKADIRAALKGDKRTLPEFLLKMANTPDPDPFFNEDYNWYYSGGLLDIIRHNDGTSCFVWSAKDSICVSKRKHNRNNMTLETFTGAKFGLKCVQYGAESFLAVRGKHNVHLTRLDCDDTISNSIVFNQTKKNPFTDFKMYNRQLVGKLDVNFSFESTDIEYDKSTTFDVQAADTCCDRFSTFAAYSRNILLMNRKELIVLDERTGKTEPVALQLRPLSACDDFCQLKISETDDRYVFLCTAHSVVKVDMRQRRSVRKWSHMLNGPPLLCDSIALDDKEYLCVSSMADRVLLESTASETCTPVALTTPLDTMKTLAVRTPIVVRNLNRRLNFAIVGLKLIPDDAKANAFKAYYSNAFGDIFCSELGNTCSDESSIAMMHRWIEHIQMSRSELPLMATSLKEMSAVKQLHCEDLESNRLDVYADSSPVEPDLGGLDVSAYDMSTVWNVRQDEQDPKVPTEMSAVHKVSSWLDTV